MSEYVPLIDLRSDHWNIVRTLLQVHAPDRNVLAFGSRATWTAKEYSDLDLAFLGEEPIPYDVLSALSEGLRDSDLPFKVDLVDCSRIDDKLLTAICRDGVTLQVASDAGKVANLTCNRSFPLRNLVDLTLSSVDKKSKAHERKVHLCNYMDVYSNAFIRSGLDFMPATATEREVEKCQIRANDVIITKDSEEYDDIGVPALVKEDVDNLLCGYHLAILRPHPSILDGSYLYYALQIPTVQHQFRAFANGVTRFGLRKNDILRTKVPVHELRVQQAIGRVLSNLDEKIELNRHMSETLEAMARAIFNDWFVDFGPVRAKVERRQPYLPSELWNLFPAAFSDKEIPVGWEIKPLDEIAVFMNGLALQKFPAMKDDKESLPVIKIAELRAGITPRTCRASRLIPTDYVVDDGDFLFSWSGSLLAKFWTGGEAALNQHLFKVSSTRFPSWFFSQWVIHHLNEFQEIAASKATTMGHIKREHLKQTVATCPPDHAITTFGRIFDPLVERTIKNSVQSNTLANIRDLLVPKLVSGEIRIKDAETFIGRYL